MRIDRTALEHVLSAEVEFLNDARLDEKAAQLAAMPASDTYEKLEKWKKKQLRNRPQSLRAGSELVRRIDGPTADGVSLRACISPGCGSSRPRRA